MKMTNREREKYQVTHVAMQVPLERPTNGSVITLATRVRNENLGWESAPADVASKMTLL